LLQFIRGGLAALRVNNRVAKAQSGMRSAHKRRLGRLGRPSCGRLHGGWLVSPGLIRVVRVGLSPLGLCRFRLDKALVYGFRRGRTQRVGRGVRLSGLSGADRRRLRQDEARGRLTRVTARSRSTCATRAAASAATTASAGPAGGTTASSAAGKGDVGRKE
jgi:hypothetical protein